MAENMQYKFLDIGGITILKEEFDKVINISEQSAKTYANKYTDTKFEEVTHASDEIVHNHIAEHDKDSLSHNDIRETIKSLTEQIHTLLGSDDMTLEQISELISYIQENSSIIESITVGKVNVSDIVDNLTTNVSNKPLSATQGVVLKSLIDSIHQSLEEYSKTTDMLKLVYPVGAIYISAVATNPSNLFGFGTWEQLQDRFLLAASDTYNVGTTGGESEHILTIDEMPSHAHEFNRHQLWRTEDVPVSGLSDGYGVSNKTLEVYRDITTLNGSGLAHNNMPPYLAVYMWQRIA